MTGLAVVLETLSAHYMFDARGRISQGVDGGVLPRFVLGRAAEGCVWRFRSDLTEGIVASLARIAGREPGAFFDGELPAPPERLVVLGRLLAPPESLHGDIRTSLSRISVTQSGVVVGEIWRIV